MKLSLVLASFLALDSVSSFGFVLPVAPSRRVAATRAPTHLQLSASTTNDSEIPDMRVKEIKAELKERSVSFTDCFDRESLAQRLLEARQGTAVVDAPSPKEPERTTSSDDTSATASKDSTPLKEPKAPVADFDRGATLLELRAMRVAELRGELGKRNIRWANMLEKEDLVQTLLKAREAASNFSANITPGQVGALTDVQLEEELKEATTSAPLLLDVYATWCGPCKLMAPELVDAAAEFGDSVRVAKIDSDQYPDWSQQLKVQAFPTLLVFDGDGNEVKRFEGALMKNQIVDLLQPYIA
jgi:thioredoxin 1